MQSDALDFQDVLHNLNILDMLSNLQIRESWTWSASRQGRYPYVLQCCLASVRGKRMHSVLVFCNSVHSVQHALGAWADNTCCSLCLEELLCLAATCANTYLSRSGLLRAKLDIEKQFCKHFGKQSFLDQIRLTKASKSQHHPGHWVLGHSFKVQTEEGENF